MADDDADIGFESHRGVLTLLRQAQSIESDVRDIVREVHMFLDDKDGQSGHHRLHGVQGCIGRPGGSAGGKCGATTGCHLSGG